MKVVGLRVVEEEVFTTQLIPWVVPDAAVVGMVKIIMGIWVRVVLHTVWYIRVAAAVVVERLIEINTRGTAVPVPVILRAPVDAVVRVLCLFKRTLRLQTVRIRRSSRSGTRVDEVYRRPLTLWGRKLTGGISSMVSPALRAASGMESAGAIKS